MSFIQSLVFCYKKCPCWKDRGEEPSLGDCRGGSGQRKESLLPFRDFWFLREVRDSWRRALRHAEKLTEGQPHGNK